LNLTANKPSALSPSAIFIVFAVCFSAMLMDMWRGWHDNESNMIWDNVHYYGYLPATFCNHGSFDFHTEVDVYLATAPNGEKMPKVTYGVSVMQLPFFLLAYKIAINQGSSLDGFSEPFYTCTHWGGIFYGLLALIFLRSFLLKFFSDWTVAITLAVLFFGTNYFHYVLTVGEASHVYLFCLNSVFLLVTWHWYHSPSWPKTILIGFLMGLISLIRPIDILTALIFFLWMVHNKESFVEQMKRLWKAKLHMIAIGVMIFLVWLPQFLFWKKISGKYLFFSYGDERFFWEDPQIINVLFSYRKGWLVYTPLVGLAFIGFFFMKNEVKKLRPIILSLLLLNIYIISCWWDWFFGGSFGSRPFVQHLAWLSIPMAATCSYFSNVNIKEQLRFLRPLFFAVIFTGISLLVMQNYQFLQGYIHPYGMTKKSYWKIFGRYNLTESERTGLWGVWREPDYKKLRSGEDRNQ
jgi:hypothetical protein